MRRIQRRQSALLAARALTRSRRSGRRSPNQRLQSYPVCSWLSRSLLAPSLRACAARAALFPGRGPQAQGAARRGRLLDWLGRLLLVRVVLVGVLIVCWLPSFSIVRLALVIGSIRPGAAKLLGGAAIHVLSLFLVLIVRFIKCLCLICIRLVVLCRVPLGIAIHLFKIVFLLIGWLERGLAAHKAGEQARKGQPGSQPGQEQQPGPQAQKAADGDGACGSAAQEDAD